MSKAKGLTFEEFMALAKQHYERGGDAYVECWDRKTFDEYVGNWGNITRRKALKMFDEEYDIQRDRQGWYL